MLYVVQRANFAFGFDFYLLRRDLKGQIINCIIRLLIKISCNRRLEENEINELKGEIFLLYIHTVYKKNDVTFQGKPFHLIKLCV